MNILMHKCAQPSGFTHGTVKPMIVVEIKTTIVQYTLSEVLNECCPNIHQYFNPRTNWGKMDTVEFYHVDVSTTGR